MGDAKRRSLTRKEILEAASRCVYCLSAEVTELEHMPPIGLFENKDRPDGWAFGCCERCNKGTRGADALAQFVAKMEVITEDEWKVASMLKVRAAVDKYAPGVMEELFGRGQWNDTLVRRDGSLYRSKSVRADGPLTKKNLDLFSAKAAMAAFRNFTGRPLEMQSLIYTEWFLNGGLSSQIFENLVGIMPGFAQLTQGKKVSGKQFSLRYNTNREDIVAALLSFHDSLHILVIATDNPIFSEHLAETFSKIPRMVQPTINSTRAGLSEIDPM